MTRTLTPTLSPAQYKRRKALLKAADHSLSPRGLATSRIYPWMERQELDVLIAEALPRVLDRHLGD